MRGMYREEIISSPSLYIYIIYPSFRQSLDGSTVVFYLGEFNERFIYIYIIYIFRDHYPPVAFTYA